MGAIGFGLTVCGGLACLVSAALAESPRPNLVFVFTDLS